MNQSDINNYNNILSNTKILYSDKLWLGITNNTICNGITNNTICNGITNNTICNGITNNTICNGITNNTICNGNNINNSLTITEKLEKELNERKYNTFINQ
jgi:bacterioferritin-associated ferredoxin